MQMLMKASQPGGSGKKMSNDIIVSRKDVREAIVRTALKDESFRELLIANPKLAVERALGTKLPEDMDVAVLQETDQKMFIVLPMQLPFDDRADFEDAQRGRLGSQGVSGGNW